MSAIDMWISYIIVVIQANCIMYLPHIVIHDWIYKNLLYHNNYVTSILLLDITKFKRITDTAINDQVCSYGYRWLSGDFVHNGVGIYINLIFLTCDLNVTVVSFIDH